MPIKLPKGFTRRKSSGNALDEVENPPEPSFKVFERPGVGGRSFESSTALKGASDGRYYRQSTEDTDNIFAGSEKSVPKNRGSGGTNHSTSTAGLYDSSSSARLSSSSTLPSSTDVPLHNNPSRGFHDIPVPPVPESSSFFSLRAAGRTFSFGAKSGRLPTPPQPQPQSTPSPARERAMTASSASTATPPKLLDSDLNLGGGDDNFGDMFETFSKRRSAVLLESSKSENGLTKVPSKDDRAGQLSPINVDRSKQIEPSPHSWNSQTSQDELMRSPPGGEERETPVPRKPLPTSQSMPSATTQRPASPTSNLPVSISSPRVQDAQSSAHPVSRKASRPTGSRSSVVEDADARIVRESLLLSRRHTQPITLESRYQGAEEEQPLFDGDEIMSSAQLASQYEERAALTPNIQNKVMTPAQFERYRQQRELTRHLSKASNSQKSDDSSDYEEDEDDEAEKSRETARQRQKQQAHLSVYRQQMMKVIGEQSPVSSNTAQPPRPAIDRASASTPNLTSRFSTLGISMENPDSGKTSDGGDDDEDVPLGILAAHGFPNRNRPPSTQLAPSSSNPNLRGSFVASPGSVSGDPAASRGSLPVFARNLPKDPYYGASLVNQPNRESLALGSGAPAFGGPPSSLHPGGLVGVIATEERARAMRRGSPNSQAAGIHRPYSAADMAHVGPQTVPSGPWGMPGMPSPQQGMTLGEQAQLQISQQMTEFMQVQMQMWQQMMQMQGMSPGQPGQPNHNFPPVGQPVNTASRPMSMGSSFHLPPIPPQVDQRTLSILDPGMSRWNVNRLASLFPDANGPPGSLPGGQGYTPSIAPSERSNVGMASRYRPISTMGPEPHMNRSSTFTSSSKPWNNENQRPPSFAPSPNQAADRKSTSLATVTVRPVSAHGHERAASKSNNGGASDDDEDEGWADMMKKREKKKSSWKMKKGASGLGDLLHMVH